MARKLIVEIIGDASSLERSLGGAEASSSRFGSSMGKLAGAAKVAGAAVAGGLAYGLFESVKAAMTAQEATARLDQAFKAGGLNAARYGGEIDKAEASSRKLGFAGNEVKTALGSLVTATGSMAESTRDLSIAEDLARFKGVSLDTATRALTLARTGSTRALRQLGILVPTVTKAEDALREAHVKTTTEAGKSEFAHAKLADKLATAAGAVDILKQKVQGQAQVFAGTAAGSVQVFHEELQHLEVTLGTALLPAITHAIQVVSSLIEKLASSPAVMEAVRIAAQVVGDVMHTVTVALKDVVGWLERHRTAAIALGVALGVLGIAFSGPIAIIAALGVGLIEAYKRSQAFRDIVNGAFDAVHNKITQVMPTILAIVRGVVTVAEALWKEFGGTLISVARTAIDTVAHVIGDLARIIGAVFTAIGDLIHGRWGKLWGDLKTIVSNAFDALATLLKAEVTIALTLAESIGKALLDGILHGITGLASGLAGKMKSEIGGAISAVKGFFHIGSPSQTTADEIGSPLGEGVLVGWLLSTASLPAKMSQTLQNAINAGRAVIQAARSAFSTDFGSLMSIADNALAAVQGAVQTPAEKALARLQAAHDAAQQAANLSSARDQLTAAQAAGDPAQILAAQQAVDDLLYQAHLAALQKKADAERLNLNARLAVQKMNFDQQLAALQDSLAKHGATAAQANEAILQLFRKYGIKFSAVGRDMGIAWVQALKDAIEEAAGKAGLLSGAVADIAAGIHIPALAAGGIVTRPTLAMIGEAGPEAVIPLGNGSGGAPGGGGVTVNVTVNGWVGDSTALAYKIRDELRRIGRLEPNIGLT